MRRLEEQAARVEAFERAFRSALSATWQVETLRVLHLGQQFACSWRFTDEYVMDWNAVVSPMEVTPGRLDIDPDGRRQGRARQLLDALAAAGRAIGATHLRIEADMTGSLAWPNMYRDRLKWDVDRSATFLVESLADHARRWDPASEFHELVADLERWTGISLRHVHTQALDDIECRRILLATEGPWWFYNRSNEKKRITDPGTLEEVTLGGSVLRHGSWEALVDIRDP